MIEGAVDSLEGETKVYYDAIVSGLRLRIGRHRRTWFYFQEYSIKGKRGTAFRRLGFWPRMTVADARKEALQHAARVAAGRPQPGRRQAITLEAGLADYIASLETRGKKSARFVASLARLHLIPEFGRFTLAELSDTPALLRDHHLRISKAKPVSANRVMSILNAVYRHASRLDRSLPPASPISAVRFNREEPKQSAMPFDQFSAWRERVETLPAIRQAYHRLMLLSGIRGGEAQRLQWSDVNVRARTITLRQRKRGADIEIPMSAAIARELKRVRRSGKPEPNALIFPGARKWNDALAFKGHALRHTFASVAADLNIGELQRRLLMGHSLRGDQSKLRHEGSSGRRSGLARCATRCLTPHHFAVGLSVILIVNGLVLAFALAAKRLNASTTLSMA